MANPASIAIDQFEILCKCGAPVDIISSTGDRFRRHSICKQVSSNHAVRRA